MSFCLHKDDVVRFKQALKDKTLDPAKLADMDSEGRRTAFENVVGKDNAEAVNKLFESKLLLKNTQQGMITWAKTVAGMKPQVRRDLVSRIERLDERILDPKEEKLFLKDLASQKLGTNVTFDEIKQINDLADNVKKTRAEMEKGGDRLEYGRALYDLRDTVDDMKHNRVGHTKLFGEVLRHPMASAGESIGRGVKSGVEVVKHPVRSAGRAVKSIPGTSKAIQASMDDSGVFRQGWRAMFIHPGIWAKNAKQSFVNLFGKYGGREVERELQADIASRPLALDGTYRKAKLDVGMPEEAFPTSLPEKVPLLGRVYKRTEGAYMAFVQKTRADIFDKYIEIAKKTGVDLTDNELRRIGEMANAQTGRGDLGQLEQVGKTVNNVLFSPKFLASHVDNFVQPFVGQSAAKLFNPDEHGSNFVRREQAKALARVIVGQAIIMGIAKSLAPNSITLDPRSADFGKIRVGNTRFDITGGYGSLAVLAGRLISGQSKSSITGKVTDLSNPKFGESTRKDVVLNFGENKLSPIGNILRDYLANKDRSGMTPTVGGEALSLATPLPVKNAVEIFKDPTASNTLRVATILADAMGISTNTYGVNKEGSVSEDAKALQEKQAKIANLMDRVEMADSRGEDSSELKKQLAEKLEKKLDSGKLTEAEAERANKLFGTDDYYGQIEDDEAPKFSKYNKNADGIIERTVGWAKAIGTSPIDAFDKLTQGETFARMENGAIIVKRMNLQDSSEMRRKLGGGGKKVKLEHLVPLSIGGTNAESNLRLVTTEEHDAWTPVETYLAGALHDEKIDQKKAQQLITDLKDKKITREELIKEVGEPFTESESGSTSSGKPAKGLKLQMPRMPKLH